MTANAHNTAKSGTQSGTHIAVLFLLIACMMPILPVEAREIRVIDGDTLMVDGERMRMIGYDTPGHDWRSAKCIGEIRRGQRATRHLQNLLDGAARIRIYRKGTGLWGRTLVTVKIDRVDVMELMVKAGHAAINHTKKRLDWCHPPLPVDTPTPINDLN